MYAGASGSLAVCLLAFFAVPQSSLGQPAPATLRIDHLRIAPSGLPADKEIAVNGSLALVLNEPPPDRADRYVLFLDGNEMKGLAPPTYSTLRNGEHGLVFELARKSDDDAFWKALLGAPQHLTAKVFVSLGEKPDSCQPAQPGCNSNTTRLPGVESTVEFEIASRVWLTVAAAAVLLMLFFLWAYARTSTTLRDNLLPQLPAKEQPWSLGRCQMTFWFVLVFASFLFLYVLLWDYNTISPQALALMGIASATALASVAVDVAKDSPADAANRALQALGLNSFADVTRVKDEIAIREARLSNPDAAVDGTAAKQLQAEIQDRRNILRTYDDKCGPFRSQSFLKDITTDLNGPTVHRVQVVVWTVTLGLVFLVGVYRDLAMPEFSSTLLALMGISGAGYVGFKYPEKNN